MLSTQRQEERGGCIRTLLWPYKAFFSTPEIHFGVSKAHAQETEARIAVRRQKKTTSDCARFVMFVFLTLEGIQLKPSLSLAADCSSIPIYGSHRFPNDAACCSHFCLPRSDGPVGAQSSLKASPPFRSLAATLHRKCV